MNSNPNINLVLMDIRMPDVNGIEAAEAIKKIRPELPVVAQTCYEKDLILDDYPQAHFDGFICKPVNINKLFEIIDHLF